MSEKTRLCLISDIHGCVAELRELLAKINYDQQTDRLCVIGDLVDRGPDSPGVVKLLYDLGVEIVKGNHESTYLRYVDYEDRIASGAFTKQNPMRTPDAFRLAQWKAIPREHRDWIAAAPWYMRLTWGDKRWILVHGGMELAGISIEEQDPKIICRVRFLKQNGKMAHAARRGEAQEGVEWAKLWNGEENVVVGHAVHSLTDVRIDKGYGGTVYSIDTGAPFGGRLSALLIAQDGTASVEQVQSHAQYAQLPLTPYE